MSTTSNLAVITGASRGIGASIALTLAQKGVHPILVGRNKKGLTAVRDYLHAEGLVGHILPLDITRPNALDNIPQMLDTLGGRLRMVVHNAGMVRVGKIDSMPFDAWQQMMDVNLNAPFWLSQKMIPFMEKPAQFVFINSVAGKQVFPEWAGYCASKFGLKALADGLRMEVQEKGVRVTTLYPGAVDTLIHDDHPYDWDKSKMLKPTDVARAVGHLYDLPAHVCMDNLDIESSSGKF